MKNKVTYILILLLINSSCVSKKPFAKTISDPDYNQRYTADKPMFIKKENAIGVSLSVGATALGGYLSYNYGLMKPTRVENDRSSRIGSGIIGSIVTYSLTRIITRYIGKDKISDISDKNKWVKGLNNDFAYLNSDKTNQFKIMNTRVEPNYIVKNFNDVKDYHKAFPVSSYSEQMLAKALKIVDRDEIPKLLQMYPDSKLNTEFKVRYYELSNTISEIKGAYTTYPEVSDKFNICNFFNSISSQPNSDDLSYLVCNFKTVTCFKSIKRRFLQSLKTIEKCKIMIKKMPDLSQEISERAMNLALSIPDYYKVSKFVVNEEEAEQRAFLMANTLKNREEFVKYFKNGTHYYMVKKSIEKEYQYRDAIKNDIDNYVRKEGINIARKVSLFNVYSEEDIIINTIVKPSFETDSNIMEGEYELIWKAEYNDIGDSGGINLLMRGTLALVTNNTAPLRETKTVPMSIKGKVVYNKKTNELSFKPYFYSKYVEKSKRWKNDTPIYLGTLAIIGAGLYTAGKYASENGWLDGDISHSISEIEENKKDRNNLPTNKKRNILKKNSSNGKMSIMKDGYYNYGKYSSQQYKIICPNTNISYRIYFNRQKKCWMKRGSILCDYTLSNSEIGLKKAASYVCD